MDRESGGRRSIRLSAFDYSTEGAYALTICSPDHQYLFGRIEDDLSTVNQVGQIIIEEWLKSNRIRQEIVTDQFVVMPNHFHGILFIQWEGLCESVGANGIRPPHSVNEPMRKFGTGSGSRSVSSFVIGFKGSVTSRVRKLLNDSQFAVWQRGFYEHVIRDEQDLYNQRQYIQNNPRQWELDEYYRG